MSKYVLGQLLDMLYDLLGHYHMYFAEVLCTVLNMEFFDRLYSTG